MADDEIFVEKAVNRLEHITDTAVVAARESLLSYCMLMDPNFIVAPHHLLMSQALERLYHGHTSRLMIFMPPRGGKSYICAQYFPSWCLGKMPMWNMITLSASGKLADFFSNEVRDHVNSEAYKLIFPDVELKKDAKATGRWQTNKKGIFVSAGVEARIEGRGANLVVLDDPASRDDAMSKAKRATLLRKYEQTFQNRLLGQGRVLLVNTRWHTHDLSGSLLAKGKTDEGFGDDWEIVSLPGLLETPEQVDMLMGARQQMIDARLIDKKYPEFRIGGPFWPALPENMKRQYGLRGYTEKEMLNKKASMSSMDWNSLFQQRPAEEDGDILKRKWWQKWKEPQPPEDILYTVMSVDTAFSTREKADYSAVTVWGVFKDRFSRSGIPSAILLAGFKDRLPYPDLKQKVFDLYDLYDPDIVLVEKKASGMSLIQDLRQSGMSVTEWVPDKDKVARAYASQSSLEHGLIWAPTKDGGDDFKDFAEDVINECSLFPNSTYDDYVDTVTQVIMWLRKSGRVVGGYEGPVEDDPYEEYDKMKRKRGYY